MTTLDNFGNAVRGKKTAACSGGSEFKVFSGGVSTTRKIGDHNSRKLTK